VQGIRESHRAEPLYEETRNERMRSLSAVVQVVYSLVVYVKRVYICPMFSLGSIERILSSILLEAATFSNTSKVLDEKRKQHSEHFTRDNRIHRK